MPKFRTVNLSKYFNSPAKLGAARGKGRSRWNRFLVRASLKMPRGKQRFWGIPFTLGPEDLRKKGVIVLDRSAREVEVKLTGRATHICFAHFVDAARMRGVIPSPGLQVGEYVVRYKEGREHVRPVRLRFEVGRLSFAAAPLGMPRSGGPEDPLPWSRRQVNVVRPPTFPGEVYALDNPRPERELASVVMRLRGEAKLGVMGITLYDGPGHPLHHLPRRFYKLTVPTEEKALPSEVKAELDMGDVTKVSGATATKDEWVKETERGLGVRESQAKASRQFLVEATGAEGATLSVKAGSARRHDVPFGEAFNKGRARSTDGAARLELVHRRKRWLFVNVIDDSTGKSTPTRIHFHGPNGEYIPPYGHHAEVNPNWFEDYGGDLQLGGTSYAYVPGRFQIELPVGDVYVEMAKGFEYAPVRKKLSIGPGQRELNLHINRWTDLRKDGWVTADTHVHFISPQTAWLEGQAEGLNLINLLASQWGRLFTNVADITGKVSGCSADGTIVWVGTENRNHLLGHMSILGAKGDPVFPMCAGGPNEAYLGDPDYMLLTEWAQKCKERDGVTIRPHFPGPSCEEPVYFVLGQLDGTELRHYGHPDAKTLDSYCFTEWYKYLNCGYRVAAVGGTDKMSARMPVGGARTYAKLDPNRPFTFENWGGAIRAGRTFTSSGPLIDMTVDGRSVGDEIQMSGGGGSVEVQARAECAWPMHAIEIVVNGRVVARSSSKRGAKALSIKANVKISRSSWIAARSGSRLVAQHAWPIQLGAHTSPVYVVVGGRELFNASDATYMVTLIDGGLTYLDTLSVKFEERRHQEMKAIFRKARRVLEERLREQR